MTCGGKILYQGPCVRGREVKVIDCEQCGYAHQDPMPSEEELREFYRGDYFRSTRPTTGARDYDAEWERARAYWEIVYDDHLKTIRSLDVTRNGIKLLDVGCGVVPRWLMHCKSRGEKLEGWCGTEASTPRTLITPVSFVDDIPSDGRQFNVATLFYVLEHVREPLKVLNQVSAALEPNGVIVVEVPNDFNPLQNYLWREKRPLPWVAYEHLNYFNPRALWALLLDAGFKVFENYMTCPVEFCALINSGEYPPEVNEWRARLQRFCSSMPRNNTLATNWDEAIGRSVVLYGRRT